MKKQLIFIWLPSNCFYILIILTNFVGNDCVCTKGEAFLKFNNCISDCNETELFQDKNCIPISKNEEDINNMYNKIVSYYNNISINMFDNRIVIGGEGINYIITTNLIENSNSNSYFLNLEENCINSINEVTTNYYIILINIINTDYISNKNGIRIFNNNNEKYLLSGLCEKQTINIGIPIEVTNDEIDLFKKIKSEFNYEIFNIYGPFYTDKCTEFTSEYTTDLTLQKRNDIYGIYTKDVCSNFCIYQKFVENEQKIYCKCKLGEEQIQNNEIEKEMFNYKVIKCINKIGKYIKKNYMLFIMSILCFLFILCFILTCIQLTTAINDYVEDFDTLKKNFLNCYKIEEKRKIEEDLKRKEEIEKEENAEINDEDEEEEDEESDESVETNDNIKENNNNINQNNNNNYANNQNAEINPYMQYQQYQMQIYNQYLDFLREINNNKKKEEELKEKEKRKKNEKKVKFKWLDGDNKFILKVDKSKIKELAQKQKEKEEEFNKNKFQEEKEEENGKDVKFEWLEDNKTLTLKLDKKTIKELAKKQKKKEEKANKKKFKKEIKKKNKSESIKINKKYDQEEVSKKKFKNKENKSNLKQQLKNKNIKKSKNKIKNIDKNKNIEIFKKKKGEKKSNLIFKEDDEYKKNNLESNSEGNEEDENEEDDDTEEESKEEIETYNNEIKNNIQTENEYKEKKKRGIKLNLNDSRENSAQRKIANNNTINNIMDKISIQKQNSNLKKLENDEKLTIKFGSDEFYKMLNIIPEEKRWDFYNITELNFMEYEHSCNYDTRNFLSIYFSIIIEENDLIYSISLCANDFNLSIVKFSYFIIQLILYLTVSAVFFSDDIINNFFNNKNQFKIGYMIKPISFTFLICLLICILLKTLTKIDNNVIDIKYKIETYEESLNAIRLKLILYFLFGSIISAFGWILVSTWSSIFVNSQFKLVKCAVFAFVFHFALQIIYCVIITSLRICSLNSEHKKFKFLYNFSKILTYF